MTDFFAGNDELILVKKQADKDSPVVDWTDAMAFRVYEFSKDPVRAIAGLDETDNSAQQGASHVTAITPGLSFGCYGRPSELALISEALLGDNDDDGMAEPWTHTATPDQTPVYYSIAQVLPYAFVVYDGCVLTAASFTATDSGDTTLRVTGMNWMVLGVTHGGSEPGSLPTPADELPFIYAEVAVSYDTDHPGTTTTFTVNVNRNATRLQGDSGFRALAINLGKFQVDGSVTRYTADDDTLRLVDTGDASGTVPTTAIGTEALEIEFTRGTGGDLRSFTITATEIAYETREEAIDPSAGSPFAEVLGWRTQPQADIADNLILTTVNGLATPGAAPDGP